MVRWLLRGPTLTTIGYQETHPLSQAGPAFNVVITLSGVSLVLLANGALTQALLEFELQNLFRKAAQMEPDIGRLADHHIICGAGRVGRSAARELVRRPVPFVVIERNEAKAQKSSSENWLMLVGDATVEQTPRVAQIERARGLVTATTMAEKHLTYIFAGQRIARSFLRPHVVSFLDTATTHLGRDPEIGEVAITGASRFAGKTIEKSWIGQDRGVIILAIKRSAGTRFNPAPDDRGEAEDYLIAMGEPQQLRELEQMAESQT